MDSIKNTVERQKSSDWMDILSNQIESNSDAYYYDILTEKERDTLNILLESKLAMIEKELIKYDKKLMIKNCKK